MEQWVYRVTSQDMYGSNIAGYISPEFKAKLLGYDIDVQAYT
jgi:hypothetical protein